MQLEYYSLPLSPASVMLRKEHPKCSLKQSVSQHLHLLLTTAFGELPHDDNFGCGIWDHDFDNITSGHTLKEMMRQSLLQSIHQYEKRLGAVRIELLIKQEELSDGSSNRRAKKKMDITITGILQQTNETFIYKDSFFTGPLSYR